MIGATGGSFGPVVRRKAASCNVECSGSEATGERGTNFEGTGGVFVAEFLGFFIIGVDGMLRIAWSGGGRFICTAGNDPRLSYGAPRNDSGPVERRKSDSSRVESS